MEQVDMTTAAGRAGLVALAKPLLAQLPRESLREVLANRLHFETGLAAHQIDRHRPPAARGGGRRPRASDPMRQGQLPPLALAISLLLQHPRLAASIPNPRGLTQLDERGSEVLLALVDRITADPAITTARLLESLRDEASHARLEELAARTHLIAAEALEAQFNDAVARLLQMHTERRRLRLIEQIRRESDQAGKRALQQELKALLDAGKGVAGAGEVAPKAPDDAGGKAAGL